MAYGWRAEEQARNAEDIAKRFANRAVTTPQIVLFGITGGLMPCPAAFTILLVCLQLKRATLGFAIVGAFSFGLALTMVTVGSQFGFRLAMASAVLPAIALFTTAALIIHYASVLGIPLSTTHAISTSIMGVGAVKRFGAVKWTVVERILWAWVFTLPVCGLIGYFTERLCVALGYK